MEQIVEDHPCAPLVIDVIWECRRERVNVMPEYVPSFPDGFADGQLGPEIAVGDVVVRENDR